MPEISAARSYGAVFDTVAIEYDRHRPRYPDALIGQACEAGEVAAGDRVLEIGCGTGQLTRGLLDRGLSVTAVEPGQNLISLARRIGPNVEFVNRRFEDAPLGGRFRAVFSAAAFHWIDPDVGWRKAARSLLPGGVLALIQYCGLRDERTAAETDAFMSALAAVAPDLAADWPPLRDLDTILAGAQQRRENVSEVWAWISGCAVARSHATALFGGVEVAVVPVVVEQTADELNALFRTTSVYHRLSAAQQEALERTTAEIEDRLGRAIRSSMVAVLVTARRVQNRV